MPHTTVNGVDLFHDEAGSGPPILFHHGYTSSHDTWDGVVERLQDRFRCIVMDGRGAGDSARPNDGYTIRQMANDVIGLADALGLGRFTYVGHSMGGVMGMELGLDHAARLEKLVLVAPAPADGVPADSPDRDRARALWLAKDRDALIRDRAAAGVDRALSVAPGHFDGCWDALVAYARGEELGRIQTPTLVMAGAADGLLPANLRDFRRLGNASLHVFSRVSHGIPREVPAAFSRVLADFMAHGVVTAATLREAVPAQ